jgi:hypothetical protein
MVCRRSVLRNATSVSAASVNRTWCSPEVLKSVRTRRVLRKVEPLSSAVVRIASVRSAPSKLVSVRSLLLNRPPVRSAFVKFAPRSALAPNLAARAETPEKSLPRRSLASNRVTTLRSSTRDRFDTSRTVSSMSPMLSTVSAKAVASSLPSARSSRNLSCRSARRSAFSSSMLFVPSCGAKTPSTYSLSLSFIVVVLYIKVSSTRFAYSQVVLLCA